MVDSLTPDRDPALPAQDPPRHTAAGTADVRRLLSEELFAGQRVVLIQHAGEEYRLMITRNDRLILQK
jgi:hemin uptake protein HemP